MAGLTTYGANNIVVTRDYSCVFNEVNMGQPDLYIEIQPSGSSSPNVVKVTNWFKAIAVESASWQYVGMDYDTAMSCANAMRNLLTYSKYVWEWGEWVDTGGVVKLGWHKAASTPTLESEVTVSKFGEGGLYDVTVNAKMQQEEYGTDPGLSITSTRPLRSILNNLAGFNTSITPHGKYYTSASADNINIVTAPTYSRAFELVGSNMTMVKPDPTVPGGYVFPNWYKVRDTYQCEVKFVGMTRAACANFYNSMNQLGGSGGLWHRSHPWVYDAVTSQGTVSMDWVEDATVWQYQCLNTFNAGPVGAGLWEISVQLTQWQEHYTMNPNESFTPSWPSEWSNVPGLSNYL